MSDRQVMRMYYYLFMKGVRKGEKENSCRRRKSSLWRRKSLERKAEKARRKPKETRKTGKLTKPREVREVREREGLDLGLPKFL
jgi:hypothetical protein